MFVKKKNIAKNRTKYCELFSFSKLSLGAFLESSIKCIY